VNRQDLMSLDYCGDLIWC